MDFVPTQISCPSDCTGAAAFGLLPKAGLAPTESWLRTKDLVRLDACGAASLRALVEFRARYQQQRIHLDLPTEARVRATLVTGLGGDLPHKLLFSPGLAPSRAARTVLLPACPVRSLGDIDAITGHLLASASSYDRRSIKLAALALAHLTENALVHAVDSPTPPVAAVTFERDLDVLRLAVVDLGATIGRHQDADKVLAECAAKSADGDGQGLALLVETAARRERDARLILASGNGRLVWDSGGPRSSKAFEIGGFAAWLDVAIPR